MDRDELDEGKEAYLPDCVCRVFTSGGTFQPLPHHYMREAGTPSTRHMYSYAMHSHHPTTPIMHIAYYYYTRSSF